MFVMPPEWAATRAQRQADYQPPVARLDCRAPESDISQHAAFSVLRVKNLVSSIGRTLAAPMSAEDLDSRLDGMARDCQAKAVSEDIELKGKIARMLDVHWWRRNLRSQCLIENERIEHGAGMIRRKGQVYASDHAGKVKRERMKANRETLARLECVSDHGDALSMLEVSDASTSNPKLRRGELMMRCRGFEETAEFMGHAAIFLTMTCPSRFHRFAVNGTDNKNWDGATPRDGQDYLSATWAKIRAAWGRQGFAPYGFRVAEPHHDGCPHWHILLFAPPADVGWFLPERLIAGRADSGAGIIGIAGRYTLNDSNTEAGAAKHRFTIKHIDPSQGSATGYIAKYICKNIDGAKEDGEDMGLDFASGKNATEASKRVRDWATTWHIRQFQQIGGPSVTVWRELRRLGEGATCQQELFEKPRAAADRADWMSFWMVQGGPEVKRTELTMKPFYIADSLGKYGDETSRIKGVLGTDPTGDYVQVTRTKVWTVQPAGANDQNERQAEWEQAMAFARTNAAFIAAYSDFEFQRIGEADQARTGVNNCTPPPKKMPTFDFSKFESEPDSGILFGHPGRTVRTADPDDIAEAMEVAQAEQDHIDHNHFSTTWS